MCTFFELGLEVKEEMAFEDVSILSLEDIFIREPFEQFWWRAIFGTFI